MNSDRIERLTALRRALESIGRPLTLTDFEDGTAASLLFNNEELIMTGEFPEKPEWLTSFPQYLTCYLPQSCGGWQLASDAFNKIKHRARFRECLMVTLLCQRCSVLRCFDSNIHQWQRLREDPDLNRKAGCLWLLTFNFHELAQMCSLQEDDVIDLTNRKKMNKYWKYTLVKAHVDFLDVPGFVILPPTDEGHAPMKKLFSSMIKCMKSAWCGNAVVELRRDGQNAVVSSHDAGFAWEDKQEAWAVGTSSHSQINWFAPGSLLHGSQPNGSQSNCSEPTGSQPEIEAEIHDLRRKWQRVSNRTRKLALIMLFSEKPPPWEVFCSAPKPVPFDVLQHLLEDIPQFFLFFHSWCYGDIFQWVKEVRLFLEKSYSYGENCILHYPSGKCSVGFSNLYRLPPQHSVHEPAPMITAPSQTCAIPNLRSQSGNNTADFESDWNVIAVSAEEQVRDSSDDLQPYWSGNSVAPSKGGSQPQRPTTTV